jgi:hypothetical protein
MCYLLLVFMGELSVQRSTVNVTLHLIVMEVLVVAVPEVGGLGFQERDGHPARNRGHAQGQPRIPGEWASGQFIQS